MDSTKIMLNREVGLYYSLGAAKDLAALCGGLEEFGEYLKGDSAEVMDRISKVILILNSWWCRLAACNGNDTEPVTLEELDLYMDPSQMQEYMEAVTHAIEEGTKKSVKIKPIPTKTKNARGGASKSS